MGRLLQKPALGIDAAKAIAMAASDEAMLNSWSVVIAVVDDAGGLLYLERMDGIANASVDVAIGKARHAVRYRRPTSFHEGLLDGGNMVVLGLPGMLPLDGGEPVIVDGHAIGAIGVSGVQSPQDGQIARAGVRGLAVWLSAE